MKEVAQGLASLGRGPDTMLIHMSPREVSGLQSLALAAGGSLTINPNTGLPEAGFLDRILPTFVGTVLAGMSGGILAPIIGGALTQGLTTGDYSLGNMAMGGIGGYGGAGLASGLAGAASQAGAAGAAEASAQAAQQAGIDAAVEAAEEVGKASAANLGFPASAATMDATTQAGVNAASQLGISFAPTAPTFTPAAASPLQEVAVSSKMIGPASAQTPMALMQGRAMNASGIPLADAGRTGMNASGLAKGFGQTVSRAFKPGAEINLEQGFKNTFGNMSTPQKAALGMSTLSALSSMDSGKGGRKFKRQDPLYFMSKYDPSTQTYYDEYYTKDLPFGTPNTPRPFDPYYKDKKDRKREKFMSKFGYAEGGDVQTTAAPSVDNRSAAKQYFEGLLNPANPMPNNLAPYDAQANQAYLGGIRSLIAPKTSFNLNNMGISQPRNTGGTTPTGPNTGVVNPNDPFGGNYSYGYGDLNAFTRNQFGDSMFGYRPGAGSGAFGGMGGGAYVDPMDFGYMNFGGTSLSPQQQFPLNLSMAPNDPYGMEGGSNIFNQFFDATGKVLDSAPDFIKKMFNASLTGMAYNYAKDAAGDGATVATKSPTMDKILNEQLTLPTSMRGDSSGGASWGSGSGTYAYGTSLKSPKVILGPFEGHMPSSYAEGGAIPRYVEGGLSALRNEYAAGGTLLRGPGDGMSDDIKANIEGEQEARLADGEFVIPADVVAHFGNGSTEAGARHLYRVMDQIRMARTGTTKQAPEIDPDDFLNVEEGDED